MRFSRLLRANGVRTTTSEILEALEALAEVDLLDPQEFRLTLRTVLTGGREEIETFDLLFDTFWTTGPNDAQRDEDAADARGGRDEPEASPAGGTPHLLRPEDEPAAGRLGNAAYSPLESLVKKDFQDFRPEDATAFVRVARQLGRRLATRLGRRTSRERRGSSVDVRRTLRRNLSYGDAILELERKKRKVTKPRLVLLCDVSRSMDEYARFLLHFVYAFRQAFGSVEAFVFGTRLTRLTDHLRKGDVLSVVERISSEVPDWSGGTRIGESIEAFNDAFAPSLVGRHTVTIILSDGLDTGEKELMGEAMKELRRRSGRIVWLNPLLSDPDYRPLAGGMSAALPHLDVFAPAHNLASLQRLERHLRL